MGWRKLGRVWSPDDNPEWAASHATLPCPVVMSDRVRVIHSVRDADGRSMGSWFDFIPDTGEIVAQARRPSIGPGRSGFFDDAGAMPSTTWWDGSLLRCLYIGWNLSVAVPFRNAIGEAVSSDGGETFERTSYGPVLDRSPSDPSFVASPFVLESEPDRLWYLSCIGWEPGEDAVRHRYHIKHARRDERDEWRPDATVCIDFASEAEYAIARPWVVRESMGYRMWFCARGESYRIYSATSVDGMAWARESGPVLDVTPGSFDSEMTEYPAVFSWRGTRYMLYNGDGYGRSGIGLAVQSDDFEWDGDDR